MPSLSILEVFKWVLRERGEDAAFRVTAVMQQAEVIELDATLALRSAKLGLAHQLPLADSLMYATAQAFDATLWTQDADSENFPGVRYLPKRDA
jgi:predicted nucleic acid-binding protein